MKKIRFLILLVMICGSVVAMAQTITVTGVITSDEDKQPIPGAIVILKGTTNAASTDLDGFYSLANVPADATLEIRYVGMVTEYIVVNGRKTINIVMKADAVMASEVTVTALGVKREKKSLGYAMTEVKGSALVEASTVNVTNALAGQVPGLQITGGGGANTSSKITLRGMTSLTGSNQPLIVIDGIPMDNFVGGSLDPDGNSGVDFGNGLSDINPEDIESMSVLKGGSAAALYGSRAGNGVILITTKSGRAQDGLGITVQLGLAIEDMMIQPEYQNSFSQGSNGIYDNSIRSSWGVFMDGKVTGVDWKNEEVILRAYDNVNAFFRPGITDTEAVTFQQQVGRTSVYASINRMNSNSITPETTLNRTSITTRATTNLGKSDKWKLDFKINYINSKSENRPIQGRNQTNPYHTISGLPRSINLAEFEQSIDVQGKQIWWEQKNLPQDNPFWIVQYNQTSDERNRFIGFGSLSYEVTDWLRGEVKGGMDLYNTINDRKQHTGGRAKPAGSYEIGMEQFMEQNYSFLFIAEKDNLFGDFGGNLTVGGNLMAQKRQSMKSNSGDLLIPNLFTLNNGVDKPTVESGLMQRRMNSLYGSLQVNWRRSIFVDATLRNDWSSTMIKANRSYLYPSISTSIVLSELIGDNMPLWFNFAKLRASYAEVGNDLSPYQLYNLYTTGKDHWGNTTADSFNTLYDSNVVSELVKSMEVGFDLRFLDNKLRVDFAWYRTNAVNQLLDIPLDPATGYSAKKINAGNIQNEGVELSLGADIFTGNFNWTTQLNISRNQSTIKELYPGITEYGLSSRVEGIKVVATVGGAYGEIYGTTIGRVEDKDSEFYGRWLLSEEGLPTKGDQKYLGNQTPDILMGLNNSFSYKNFTLNINFDARIGGKVYSTTMAGLYRSGNAVATAPNGKRESFVVNGVIKQEDGTYKENTTAVTPYDFYLGSPYSGGDANLGLIEPFLYDATSVKLRTLSLGYNIPKKLLGNTVQRLSVGFTASNLWLIYSDIPGMDPEAVSGMNSNVTGIELGVAPTPRTFTFNMSIGF